MANFKKVVDYYVVNRMQYDNLPKFVKDMISTNYSFSHCKNYNKLTLPILTSLQSYSDTDIVDGLVWLQENGFSSFVFAESSTYALTLLYKILSLSSISDMCKSCSISSHYEVELITQYNDIRQIYGLVVKMTAKRR